MKVKFTDSRFKKIAISLDKISHDRCLALADDMSTTVSGMLRQLVKAAYDELEQRK